MRYKEFFLIIFLLHSLQSNAQERIHSRYENYSEAISIVESSERYYKSFLDNDLIFQLDQKGYYYSYDHLEHPDSSWHYLFASTLIGQPSNDFFYQQKNIRAVSDNRLVDSTQLVMLNDTVYRTDIKPALRKTEFQANIIRASWMKILPAWIISEVRLNASSLQWLGVSIIREEMCHVISYTDLRNDLWAIYIGQDTARVLRADHLHYDDLLGDVMRVYDFFEEHDEHGCHYPMRTIISEANRVVYDLHQQLILNPTLSNQSWNRPDLLKIDKDIVVKSHNIDADSVFIKQVAKNVYSIELPQTNNRLLLLLFDGYSILLEGSYHSRNGDVVLEKIHSKFPQYPIKYASYSHFHGQYIGFIRSLVYENVTLLFPPSNENLVKTIVNSNHSINPDNLYKNKKMLKYQLVNNRMIIKDKQNTLEIYQVGPNHTQEYLIFYLPKQKLIFCGDLCSIKDVLPLKAAGERTRKFYAKVKEFNLKADTVYTSWPLKGYGVKNIVPFSVLEEVSTISH